MAILIVLTAFFAFHIVGCTGESVFDNGNGDTSDTTTSSVSVSTSSTSIVADGSSQALITATVKDANDNNVADDTTVTFTTTSGTLDSATATTTNGVATVTLTSPTNVGSATITATVGEVSGDTSVSFIAGVVNTISLTATPNNLTADNTSTSTISALVTDVNSNAVADGETITFSVTAGTGTLSALTATTSEGVATVTYTASTTTGTETITAQATNGTSDTVDITLIAATIGTIGSVSVNAGSSSIVADGSSQTIITATIKDANDNNVADGTTVTFTVTAGDIDSVTAGTQSTFTATTTNGVATATLTSPTNVGSTTITATAGGVSGNTSVSFIAGAVNTISLTATPNNLTADGTSTSTITALVTDANSNVVADDETITFSVTTGTGTLSALTATTSGGVATVTYTASTTAGTETITAQATNGTSDTVDITLISEQVGNIILSLIESSLVADGQNSTLVNTTITNIQGNQVIDGTTVNFTTTGGDIDSDTVGDQLTFTDTTTGGVASAILRSGTTSGQHVIRATAGSISQVVSIQFIPGLAADVAGTTLSANPSVVDADGVSTSLITALFVDENNNPVADSTTVDFYTTAGELSAANSLTENGVATVTLTSSTSNETATVTAIADSISKEVDVQFGAGPGPGEPVYIIITADPETIQVKGTGGIESANIKASVKDENGSPYNDSVDNIQFEILTGPGGGEVLATGDGSPSTTKTTTTKDGIAIVSLDAGTISGTVQLKVTVLKDGSGSGLGTPLTAISTQIGIESGDPFNITLYKAPTVQDNGDGSLSLIISAMIQDQYGNPVADNTGVYFGLVDNPINGYKSNGTDGVTDATTTFASVGTNFLTDDVIQFDTLIILEGQDEGGHIINVRADGSVTLYYDLTCTETNLDFVAGNAERGVICGVVPTGNLEPDGTCTPEEETTAVKGVAHTRLTWGEPAIFKPFYLYAETEGRRLGDSLAQDYPGVAPIAIDVTLVPSSVFPDGTQVTVNALFHDGADHNIHDEDLTFKTDNTLLSGFGGVGTATTTATTDNNGWATVSLDTADVCLDTATDITISAYQGIYIGTATLSIRANEPTADFVYDDQEDSDNVSFSDNSTLIAGTSTTWSWTFTGGTPNTSSVQNPGAVSFGGAGNYSVSLTVTNGLGCSDTVTKIITVP